MRRQKTRVLVVDHDPLFLQLLTRYLQLEGYEVDAAGDSQRAIEQVEMHRPDLVLLDAAFLSQSAALTICQSIRERSQAPIVCIITVRIEEKSGLIELGADDYLSRPFDADELLVYMQQVLQRKQSLEIQQAHTFMQHENAQVKTIGDLTVDFAHGRALRAGHEIPLTPREYRLLVCLAQRSGRVVSQELLLQLVWGIEHAGKHH